MKKLGSAVPRVGLRIAFGVGLLGFIATRIDLSRITISWGAGILVGVGAAACCLGLAQAFGALRWRAILGEAAPGWAYLFRLYLIGSFFSIFLPTSIGGDAVRTVAAAQAVPGAGRVVTSVVLDRLFGVIALLLYLTVGLVVAPAIFDRVGTAVRWDVPAWVPAMAALAGLSAAAALAASGPARRRLAARRHLLHESWALTRGLAASPRALMRVIALGLVVQGMYIFAWMGLAMGLGFELPAGLFLFAVPLVSLLAMLPVSLSGLGVREGAWLLLLAPFGVPAADAVAYSLLYFLAFTLIGAVGGILFAARGTGLDAITRSVHPGPRPHGAPIVEGARSDGS